MHLTPPGPRASVEKGRETVNRFLRWARCLCWALAPVLALTIAAPPLAADTTAPARPASPSIRASAEARVAALAPLAATEPGPQLTTPSTFFRSRRGVVAVVLTAAMIGFMTYSLSHDRIKSPAK